MAFLAWIWKNFDWRVKLFLGYYLVAGLAMAVTAFWPEASVVWWTLLNAETSFASWQMIGVKLSAFAFFIIISLVSSLNLTFWVLASQTWQEPANRFFAKAGPLLKADWPRFHAWLAQGYNGLLSSHQRWLMWASAFDRPVIFLLGLLPMLYPVGIALIRVRKIPSGWMILYAGNLAKLAVGAGIYAVSSSTITALAGILLVWAGLARIKQSLHSRRYKVPHPKPE